MKTHFFLKATQNLFTYSNNNNNNTDNNNNNNIIEINNNEGFNGWDLYNVEAEFNRLQLDSTLWRISSLIENSNGAIMVRYPHLLIVPLHVSDEHLVELTIYRYLGRIPVLTWGKSRSFLLRSSSISFLQDDISGFSSHKLNFNQYDIFKFTGTLPDGDLVNVYDTRTREEAGTILLDTSENIRIKFLNLPLAAHLLSSIKSIYHFCTSEDPIKPDWMEELEGTKWLKFIESTIHCSNKIGKRISYSKSDYYSKRFGRWNVFCSLFFDSNNT